jgi:hypothetical protein
MSELDMGRKESPMYRRSTPGARVLAQSRLSGAVMTPDPSPEFTTCPVWCTTEHGVFAGVDDYFHLGAPLFLINDVIIRLCAGVDPDTSTTGFPYVIVSSADSDDEWTLEHTRSTGRALIALVEAAQQCG